MAKNYTYNQLVETLRLNSPLLMLDEAMVADDCITGKATKLMSINEPVFQGHFPGQPITPGVLQVAAMAQLSNLIFRLTVPVIAGTGSNDTAYGIELSRYACEVGCDALLLVTPYYNKATPRGLTESFLATAEATNKPIILYNVPSRTGVNIPLSVYKEVSKHERIVATKEASGNLSAIAEIFAECGDALDVYSGNDDQIVPILSLGGRGVISVLSGILPQETHDLCAAWFAGDPARAAEMQLHYLKLINTLFSEVNPIPVKTASALLGYCDGELRLPLCEMEPAHLAALKAVLAEYGLL